MVAGGPDSGKRVNLELRLPNMAFILHNEDMNTTTANTEKSIAQLRAPIVFVHGLFGYGQVRLKGRTFASYFAKIPEMLAAAGNRVHVAQVHPLGSVADRAGQLKSFVERVAPGEPV